MALASAIIAQMMVYTKRTDKQGDMLSFLSNGVRELSRYFNIEQLRFTSTITTIASNEDYALPSDTKSVTSMIMNNSGSGQKLDIFYLPDVWDIKWIGDTTEGFPSEALIFGDKYYLRKIPNAIYSGVMRGHKFHPELTSDEDTVYFETDIALAMGILETYYALEDFDNPAIRVWYVRLTDKLRAMKKLGMIGYSGRILSQERRSSLPSDYVVIPLI